VENRVALPANFTFFNVLLLFAQFQCNEFFARRYFRGAAERMRSAKHVKSDR
jgi:hypothetical protein